MRLTTVINPNDTGSMNDYKNYINQFNQTITEMKVNIVTKSLVKWKIK